MILIIEFFAFLCLGGALLLYHNVNDLDIEILQRTEYVITLFVLFWEGILRVYRKNKLPLFKITIISFIYLVFYNFSLCIGIFCNYPFNNIYKIFPGLVLAILYLYVKKDFPRRNKISAYMPLYLIFQIVHLVLLIVLYMVGCVYSFHSTNIIVPIIVSIILLVIMMSIDLIISIKSQNWFYKKAYIEKIQLMLIKNNIEDLKNPPKSFITFINVTLNTYFIRYFGFLNMNKILVKQLQKYNKDQKEIEEIQQTFKDQINKSLMKRKYDHSLMPVFLTQIFEKKSPPDMRLKRQSRYQY